MGSVGIWTILHFLLFVVQGKAYASSKCVPSLRINPERYEMCKFTDCFIFIDEPPFVFLPESIEKSSSHEPFRCMDHLFYSNDLTGAFFQLVKEMPSLRNAHCIYGGSECTFSSMVQFVNESTSKDGHRWIAGGLLFVVPRRIQRNVIPSAAILSDRLLVIGPPLLGTGLVEAWNTIARPFTPQAWLAIFACILLLLALRVLIVVLYPGGDESDGRCKWSRFWWRFAQLGTHPSDKERNDDESEWECLNETWMGNAKLFITITVILYEVVIAVSVLEASTSGPTAYSEVSRFAMLKDTTQEFFFMKMQRIKTVENHEWSRFKTQREVYDSLIDRKQNASLTLMWSILNRFEMTQRPQLCKYLRVYDDVSPRLAPGRKPPSVTGHWLYSSNVPLDQRIAIDREIVNRKVGYVRRIVETIAGDEIPEGCRSRVRRIDWLLILMFFLVAQGPPFLILLIVLVMLWNRRYQRQRDHSVVAEKIELSIWNGGWDTASSKSGSARLRSSI